MEFDAIVVGSGFGGTVAASQLVGKGKRVLVIERGGWWVSPLNLARPAKVPPIGMRKWLETVRAPALHQQGRRETDHLVNFWPRPDHLRGLFDLVASIRTRWNPDGLYSYRRFDEAHIPTANAVGGGSMIYSNVTIAPRPEALQRIGLNLVQGDFDKALAWMEHFRGPTNPIVTKSPPLPEEERTRLGLDLENLDADREYLYLDKSLALKTAAAKAAPKVGLEMPWRPLQLSIIDYDPIRPPKTTNASETPVPSAADKAHTYCQRQGRCLFGCLPQARHTLNKTLYGKLLVDEQFQDLIELRELAEVSSVARVEGGYEVTYRDRMNGNTEVRVSAPMVFLAAGTLGTTELLLRCAEQGTLDLSPALGRGFSSNGDFGGFAVGTTDRVHSTQGPINTCHLDIKLDDGTLVTVEDSGLPAIVAELATYALHILQLYRNENRWWRKWWFKFRMRLFWHVGRPLHLKVSPRLPHFLPRPVRARKRARPSIAQFPPRKRRGQPDTTTPTQPSPPAAGSPPGQPPAAVPGPPGSQQQWASPDPFPKTTDPLRYETEAEMVEDIFFFNTMGQDAGNGVFRLKRGLLDRIFGRPAQLDLTWDEPVESQEVFKQIDKIQQALAKEMGGDYLPMPFWGGFTKKKKLVIPHPLGGCRIATTREEGVVDEHGRVFDGDASDPTATLPGLYIVDGSVIPGALAVNPTLTITAQALKTMSAALPD